ncbi:hypothetical protein E4U41_003056 [Claviceps citrina]|nr:hypothetical protein E4U41_003056 [Claviceps citrina]
MVVAPDVDQNRQDRHQASQIPWQEEGQGCEGEQAASTEADPRAPRTPLQPADGPAAPRPGRVVEPVNRPDEDDSAWDEATGRPSDENKAGRPRQAPGLPRPGSSRSASSSNPFLQRKSVPQASGAPPLADAFAELDIDDDAAPSTNPWRQHDDRDVAQLPSKAMSDELLEEQNVWDDLGAVDKGKGTETTASAASAGQAAQMEGWSLVDANTSSSSPKMTQLDENPCHDDSKPPSPPPPPPPLPRRCTGLQRKWVPSRQPVDAKAETYEIKNIKWHDPSSHDNPRTSPILIQNENGPCPLVALVNALTMTTPSDSAETTLVEVLRSREQISLHLLLKAVFDELMSARRTSSDKALPDVSDLYAFLQSLHTGMNVNPRFVPTPEMVEAYRRTSLTHLPPAEPGSLMPGTFENTVEMSLYATFSVPLIHGWLPEPGDAVYGAMERQAASYEDVQNLLFCEEELTEKLSSDEGLTEEEQQLYQDIMTIKMFLDSSATQLTAWGIEVIGKAMRPGTFAILFRNDHFSTLYRHPQTLQLLTLVTDAGYGKHKEVVWESLVDVNGEHSAFLSGDCKVVGSGSQEASPGHGGASAASAASASTATDDRGKTRQQDAEAAALSPLEQEDRDLALALQLQEEEDQRHRAEQSRRRRESILSEQFIERQGQGHGPLPVTRDGRRTSQTMGLAPERSSSSSYSIPVTTTTTARRQTSGTTTTTTSTPHSPQSSTSQLQPVPQQQIVRPLVPPRRRGVHRAAEANEGDAPPSYEQAAQDPAFVPPMGHATHSQSSLAVSTHNAAAAAAAAAAVGGSDRPTSTDQARRRQALGYGGTGGGSGGGSGSGGRQRDCVVM